MGEGGGLLDSSYWDRLLQGNLILVQRPINSLEERSMSFSNPRSKILLFFVFVVPNINVSMNVNAVR